MDHAEFNRAINWQPRPFQLQGHWTFNDFHGKQWPGFFKTKRAAEEQGHRHIEAVLQSMKETDRRL